MPLDYDNRQRDIRGPLNPDYFMVSFGIDESKFDRLCEIVEITDAFEFMFSDQLGSRCNVTGNFSINSCCLVSGSTGEGNKFSLEEAERRMPNSDKLLPIF